MTEIDSREWVCLRQRLNSRARSPGASVPFLNEAYAAVFRLVTRTSLPGSGKAKGLSRMEFTIVNIETLPPMPMLRERIAVSAKVGAERRARKALHKFSIHIVPSSLGVPELALRRANILPLANTLSIQPRSRQIGRMCVFASGTDGSADGQRSVGKGECLRQAEAS